MPILPICLVVTVLPSRSALSDLSFPSYDLSLLLCIWSCSFHTVFRAADRLVFWKRPCGQGTVLSISSRVSVPRVPSFWQNLLCLYAMHLFPLQSHPSRLQCLGHKHSGMETVFTSGIGHAFSHFGDIVHVVPFAWNILPSTGAGSPSSHFLSHLSFPFHQKTSLIFQAWRSCSFHVLTQRLLI